MMFPRDTILYFLAVAEYVTASKSDRASSVGIRIVASSQEEATSRGLKQWSSYKPSKSSKSSKSNVFETPAPTPKVSLDDLDDLLKQAALDKNLQPTLRGLKALVEADPKCHTGNSIDVTKACAGECCTGKLACLWNGEATVCEGACSGELSCAGIPTNSVIMGGSCSGVQACIAIGSGDDESSDNFIPVFIGPESCVNARFQETCGLMGASAETVVVAGASCRGSLSYFSLASETTKPIFIGPHSCDGHQACVGMANSAENAAIFIGSDSCRGDLGCGEIAEKSTNVTSIAIGDESCIDYNSCEGLGFQTVSTISIGAQSCRGDQSCDLVGGDVATSISIGNGACDQIYACYNLGYQATNVVVGDSACIGEDYKCSYFGYFFAGPVVVESDECASVAEVCCAPSLYTTVPNSKCIDICDAYDPSCEVASFTWLGTTCADICQA